MDAVREEEEHEVVIVGGGIGGLATALALHRSFFSFIRCWFCVYELVAEARIVVRDKYWLIN